VTRGVAAEVRDCGGGAGAECSEERVVLRCDPLLALVVREGQRYLEYF
jgi:hypothetical protein